MSHVEPKIGAESFSCPHCGAFAHQNWRKLGIVSFRGGEKPQVIRYIDAANIIPRTGGDEDEHKRWTSFVERLKSNFVTYWYVSYVSIEWEFVNLHVSECYSCKGFSLWVADRVVYPIKDASIAAHESMPPEVRADFDEAASIVDKSPRGAAALLRLCIQKLMPFVGEKGKNINDDIASLVQKGLPVEVQRALDVVRVIGNNAVHPGQIDLKDDKSTALTLFELVNMIVERQIAGPEKLKELFAGLPKDALDAIEKRDKPKA